MKYILSLIIFFTTISAHSADMVLPISGVADGDTIRTIINLPCPLCRISARMRGIDTPESTYLAKCPKEKALGLKAKAFLIEYLSPYNKMLVKDVKWDKYGGRIDGYILVDGVDLGKMLIDKGLAVPYDGTGPKYDWCK